MRSVLEEKLWVVDERPEEVFGGATTIERGAMEGGEREGEFVVGGRARKRGEKKFVDEVGVVGAEQ